MSRSLEALASAAVPRVRAGARHVLGLPGVRAIAEDGRLTRIAARFVGVSPVPFPATLLDKSQHANWLVAWHQDTMLPVRPRVDDPPWGSWSVKGGVLCGRAPAAVLETVVTLRVHLDDSTDANGPLRVLPGTHTRGILTADAIARATREI